LNAYREASAFVSQSAIPFIEKHGIPVFGVLPDVKSLSALTVSELIKVLDAEVLTRLTRQQALVENLTVGAMTAETALSRFRKYANKAVITGGDRTDIQLAALETSTTCLVLTGNLRPSPLVVKQAEEFGVAVLLVRKNTWRPSKLSAVCGKARLGESSSSSSGADGRVQHERLCRRSG
jgi:BioD-like phosphotransacetylase family protein